jgi:hypothetical protein
MVFELDNVAVALVILVIFAAGVGAGWILRGRKSGS